MKDEIIHLYDKNLLLAVWENTTTNQIIYIYIKLLFLLFVFFYNKSRKIKKNKKQKKIKHFIILKLLYVNV